MSFTSEIKFVVSYFRVSRILFYGLRLEYALEGSSKYIACNDQMEELLEDNGIKEFIS